MQPQRPVAYADPRVPLVTEEIEQYAVAVVPILSEGDPHDGRGQGSGTCILVGGRYFVATAGHVINGFPKTRYFVLSPKRSRDVYRVVGGGCRDDRNNDVGWLELSAAAAKQLKRTWLDVRRLRPYCDGAEENLVVYGAPYVDRILGQAEDGLPTFTAVGCWWATKALHDPNDIEEYPDRDRRLYLDWPSSVDGHDGHVYLFPDAPGLSGGGIWALNLQQHGWRADRAQLVGIQYAWVPSARRRHLRAFQIHEWLKMLRQDVPELAEHIDPLLGAVILPRSTKQEKT